MRLHALGISHEHLTQGSPLLKSFYRFHVMYHLRRVLYLLGAPIPRDREFKKYNNPFDHESYGRICSEYGVDPIISLGYISDWPYTAQFGVFGNHMKKARNPTKQIIIVLTC